MSKILNKDIPVPKVWGIIEIVKVPFCDPPFLTGREMTFSCPFCNACSPNGKSASPINLSITASLSLTRILTWDCVGFLIETEKVCPHVGLLVLLAAFVLYILESHL